MEIISEGQVEPHRLRALVKLIVDLKEPDVQDIYDLLQPAALTTDQSAVKATFRIAVDCGLVADSKNTRALVSAEQVETMTAFQKLMQQCLLNVTEEGRPNYRLNLYTAWYAVQNERVFRELATLGYDGPFNTEVFPNTSESDERRFNSTKLNGWRKWATFLGFGWIRRIGSASIVIPDATVRLHTSLDALLQDKQRISFGQFMKRLATTCPELDGGKLFDYCWQASRGAEQPGNQVSLMVSTGLRTLYSQGVIELSEQADALDIWHLYPAEGSLYQRVTHIQRIGA
ncbi:MAG TPA: protein DpdG [Ktedonobacteraceae bacterium]|nr:protein DpdG [Ktedonobacteraceae bacterium]